VPWSRRQPYLGLSWLIYIVGNFPEIAQTVYEPFLGEMTMFAGDREFGNAPRAEGQLLTVNQNTGLFSVLRRGRPERFCAA
jgi:microcystin-dependent protein